MQTLILTLGNLRPLAELIDELEKFEFEMTRATVAAGFSTISKVVKDSEDKRD